jgi:RimJ/RimL family protein N-acetyltransferase
VTTQPTIEAERFALRPARLSDMGLIEHYTKDARLATMTRSIPHPLPPGATEAFIRRSMSSGRTADVWVMDGTASGGSEVMGVISLDHMDRKQSQVDYWVAPPFWSTGIASSALRAIIAANPHDSATIFAEVFQDNPGSARVLTNCGFSYLGDAEAYSIARAAKVPTWTYTLKIR